MQPNLITQSQTEIRFSEKDRETLARCRKISASKLGDLGSSPRWAVVVLVTVSLINAATQREPVAVGLALYALFMAYERHLRIRLREVSDLALRLAEKAAPSRIGEQPPESELSSALPAEEAKRDLAPIPGPLKE